MEALLLPRGEEREKKSAPPTPAIIGISTDYAARILFQMNVIADGVDLAIVSKAIEQILDASDGSRRFYIDTIRELLPENLKKKPEFRD